MYKFLEYIADGSATTKIWLLSKYWSNAQNFGRPAKYWSADEYFGRLTNIWSLGMTNLVGDTNHPSLGDQRPLGALQTTPAAPGASWTGT